METPHTTTPEVIAKQPSTEHGTRRSKIAQKLGATLLMLPLTAGLTSDTSPPKTTIVHSPKAEVLNSDTITVMSANVHGWRTSDDKPGFTIFMNTLKTQQPDVVCGNEIINDPTKIKAITGDGYSGIFVRTKLQGMGESFGNTVYSKSPIRLKDVVSLPEPETNEPRNAIVAEIKTTRGWLELTCSHLSIQRSEAEMQIRKLNREVQDSSQIVVGDFNGRRPVEINTSVGRSAVSSGTFASFISETDPIPTFPSGLEILALDEAVSRCSEVKKQSLYDIGSDHSGLIVEFDISTCDYS